MRVPVARRSARFRNRSMDEAGAGQRRGGRQSSLWGSCLGAGRGRAEETRRTGCAGEVRRVRFARWGRSARRSSGCSWHWRGAARVAGTDVRSCDRAGDGRWAKASERADHAATGGARLRATGSAVRSTAFWEQTGHTRTSKPDTRKRSSRQSSGSLRRAPRSRGTADDVSLPRATSSRVVA